MKTGVFSLVLALALVDGVQAIDSNLLTNRRSTEELKIIRQLVWNILNVSISSNAFMAQVAKVLTESCAVQAAPP